MLSFRKFNWGSGGGVYAQVAIQEKIRHLALQLVQELDLLKTGNGIVAKAKFPSANKNHEEKLTSLGSILNGKYPAVFFFVAHLIEPVWIRLM